ncbi:50S ribosomal protein L25/general stress protein Ctc [Sabulicella glaciei]|uniref:Large ribosomal subunit protein bL25 n=1 Tax=Sabulicella glaciei TaxID=2984948 RepID=A0ABT3NT00_9PROT|nr:50S ribosomal protein L25/general stress protein Ctc [Roseococcus sp. MDT2-1-1]MCW8084998.1 50S ribosomal protein L25/general stress protein Ctc [Roseococcus sp. MDT2-1-1]
MVQTIRIEAAARGRAGKGAARATRREGLVPGVIYGAKEEATLIALDPRVVMKELHKGGWQSHLYEVAVTDGPTVRTLMRDVQFDPVSDRPIHIDFQRLAPGARIRVKVPVTFLNEEECPGLKAGGVLNVVRREVEVFAAVDAVPESFVIDLGEAKIGDSLRWSAVQDKGGAKPVISGRDFVVATVAPPTVDEDTTIVAPPPPPEATKQKAPPAGGAAKAPAKKK